MDFCPRCGAGVIDGMKRCPDCRKAIPAARKSGIAESPFDKDDFLRISGAVLNRNGKLAGTIGISVPVLRLKDDSSVKKLHTVVAEAAMKLSEKLD